MLAVLRSVAAGIAGATGAVDVSQVAAVAVPVTMTKVLSAIIVEARVINRMVNTSISSSSVSEWLSAFCLTALVLLHGLCQFL